MGSIIEIIISIPMNFDGPMVHLAFSINEMPGTLFRNSRVHGIFNWGEYFQEYTRVAQNYILFCQKLSDLQISNSSEKLRSFWIQICKAIFSKPLFKGLASALKFSTFLHYPKREECISRTLFCGKSLAHYRRKQTNLI